MHSLCASYIQRLMHFSTRLPMMLFRTHALRHLTFLTRSNPMKVLLILSLVRVSWLNSCVHAFPTGAGECPFGEPAVGGRHVAYDGGTRLIESGPLHQSKISFYCDGQKMTGNMPLHVLSAELHTLEIVSPIAFKGALIRVDGHSKQEEFAILPMINAQAANACTDTAKGVTHADASLKNVLSGSFRAYTQGEFTLDVTVVEYNNSTGSVYWYSQFVITTESQTPSLPIQKTPSPTTTTYAPTTTAMPSFSSACFVCGDINMNVATGDKLVNFMSLELSCGDLAELGRSFNLPPSVCPDAQILAETSCSCTETISAPEPSTVVVPTPTLFPTYDQKCHVCGEGKTVGRPNREVLILNEIATCQELQEDGRQGLIPSTTCDQVSEAAQATCECTSKTVATNSPTATVYPTAPSSPTLFEKCDVCGSDREVTNLLDTVTIDGVVGTCLELHQDGVSGYLSPSNCLKIQKISNMYCGCSDSNEISQLETFEPTASAFPTITPYPSFSEKCSVCPEGFQVVDRNKLIAFNGGIGTCAQLESDAAEGYLSPLLCDDAIQFTTAECDCEPIRPKCNICRKNNWKVTNTETQLTIDSDTTTCEKLQTMGEESLLSPKVCLVAQVEALLLCECAPENIPSSDATFSPTITPFPTQSFMPSYGENCLLCPVGSAISRPDVLVAVGGVQITCGELVEASFERMIPPSFCLQAQEESELACGCITMEPSMPDAKTFEPTVTPYPTTTATPTYEVKCEVCGTGKTVSKPDVDVAFEGMVLSCGEFQEAGNTGILPPEMCPDAQTIVSEMCGCVVVSPAPSSAAVTFEPTRTAYPTVTATPTYSEKCMVCGKEDLSVLNTDQEINVGGYRLTCGAAEGFGRSGFLPPELCPDIQRTTALLCACRVTRAPDSTARPTFAIASSSPLSLNVLARQALQVVSLLAVAFVTADVMCQS